MKYSIQVFNGSSWRELKMVHHTKKAAERAAKRAIQSRGYEKADVLESRPFVIKTIECKHEWGKLEVSAFGSPYDTFTCKKCGKKVYD